VFLVLRNCPTIFSIIDSFRLFLSLYFNFCYFVCCFLLKGLRQNAFFFSYCPICQYFGGKHPTSTSYSSKFYTFNISRITFFICLHFQEIRFTGRIGIGQESYFALFMLSHAFLCFMNSKLNIFHCSSSITIIYLIWYFKYIQIHIYYLLINTQQELRKQES
jgi:hypothetical protein